ncbi:insulinase family protein [Streptomyces sp. NPDC048196]|uniref:M16 family metallopeptidase n=1 Tax=Streptomyces sp. NPDC048196 TaxID=3154712 RepID=UPI0033D41915
MAGDPSDQGLVRAVLPNGLRILLDPVPEVPRVAVCVTYGVGFRSERPGEEGLAHLFEHLMFRGSASLPDGRFYEHIRRLGSEANGTTHQDYTDYFQVVPSAGLEPALFSEADRMRAPRFTERVLAEQLKGVEAEIRERTLDRPLGGFPWPLLPQALYSLHRNAHDGYGDIAQLKKVTLQDCADFFEEHYAPGNAVLTLAGGFDPQEAILLAKRHFGRIPPRRCPPRPELDEPFGVPGSVLTCSEPAITSTAVALGYQLPGPEKDLSRYLATVVLAGKLSRSGATDDAGHTWKASGSCGFFGPFDAVSPDALIVAGLLPGGAAPEEFLAAVRSSLARWASGDVTAEGVEAVSRRLRVEHLRNHSDLLARSRMLGRLEYLYGRPELLDEIPDQLAVVCAADVAHAAEALATAPHGLLVIEPAPVRRRPAPSVAADRPVQRQAPHPHPANERPARGHQGPLPVPPMGKHRHAELRAARDEVLPNGLRVSAIEDPRGQVVEARLRLPLGSLGLTAPHAVGRLLRDSMVRGVQEALTVSGASFAVRMSGDGQWLEALAHVPHHELEVGLAPVAAVVAAVAAADTGTVAEGENVTAEPAAEPWRLMELALWNGVCKQDGRYEGIRPSTQGGCLAVVGALSAEAALSLVKQLLPGTAETGSASARGGVPWAGAELRHVEQKGSAEAGFLLCSPEASDAEGEATRYLTTALFGGYYGSRLATALGDLGAPVAELLVGRDRFVGQRRAWVRARTAAVDAAQLLDVVCREAHRLAHEPPCTAELAQAADFCAAQMTSVFDSPAALADALARFGVLGWAPEALTTFPERLLAVTAGQVSQTAARLLRHELRGGVVMGDPTTLEALHAVWSRWRPGGST